MRNPSERVVVPDFWNDAPLDRSLRRAQMHYPYKHLTRMYMYVDEYMEAYVCMDILSLDSVAVPNDRESRSR